MSTSLKTDELENARKRELFIGALEASSDGILVSDEKGNIIYVNPAYENTTGLKKENIVGENLKTLLDLKFFNVAASLSVLESHEKVSTIHQYFTGKSALTTANPIFSKYGELIGVICNTRNISELVSLRRELEDTKILKRKYSNELKQLRQEQLKLEGLVYKSQAMEETLNFASKVAEFDSTVLITGELFESELFGYAPGSFTGASSQGKVGMFQLADGGTILLDEIGELDLSVQPKLLRVLQEMEIHPVGSEETIKIDVRVLAATNVNLAEEVKEGNFREDLFFRLNVLPIKIPSLKERKEDILEMADYFLDKLNRKYKKNIILTSEAEKVLLNYSWPGNVRELENLIEYLFIVNPSDEIGIEQMPSWVLTEHIMEEYVCEEDHCTPRLNYMLDMYEKNIITVALRKHNSIKDTAETLDIHPSTLFRKIKKHNIDTDLL